MLASALRVSASAFAVILSMATPAYSAQPRTLVATWTVASLSEVIELCRVPQAITLLGYDETWRLFIDADGNSGTGSSSGFEGALDILVSEGSGCTTYTGFVEPRLRGRVVHWDSTSQAYVLRELPPVHADFAARTLTITANLEGALAGVSSSSVVKAEAHAAYVDQGSNTILTNDLWGPASFASSMPDAAGDVALCNTPNCDPQAYWVRMVDLTRVTTAFDRLFGDGFDP